jgi:cytochrome c peroxidase
VPTQRRAQITAGILGHKRDPRTCAALILCLALMIMSWPVIGTAGDLPGDPSQDPSQDLPAVPVPAQNPLSEAKRVLGKILFWDEQLSFDNTVACGSCHQPRFGGTDGRHAANPGHDGVLGTSDDVFASMGVVHRNSRGVAVKDPVFGYGPQVGGRAAPSNFGGLWADSLFWDGRATTVFRDPVSGHVVIPKGGALESQAAAPIMNPVEMADEDRSWRAIERKLAQATPLALARHLPPDVAAAIAARGSYPQLFAAAFGDSHITAARIAFAIATYERTLVADQTPYDIWNRTGRSPDSSVARDMAVFQYNRCDVCHTPPLFTNNQFFNTGLREAYEDPGREAVTGDDHDDGSMKVPSLRNVGLQKSFMHTGEFNSLDQIFEFYSEPRSDRQKLPDGTDYTRDLGEHDDVLLEDLLDKELVDPRVAQERFPFDRPELRSERADGYASAPAAPVKAHATSRWAVKLAWQPDAPSEADDYEIERDGTVVAFVTHPYFLDETAYGPVYNYEIYARNAATRESAPLTLRVVTRWVWVWCGGPVLVFVAGAYALWRHRRALSR